MPGVVRVMTVCTGNTHRSPMAQVVIEDRLRAAGLGGQVEVVSRGVSDEEAGRPIARQARAVLLAHGYPGGDGHRARQVRADELVGTDLVLAMTRDHARVLRRLAGDRTGTVVLYRSLDPSLPPDADGRDLDVDDPWCGGPQDFEDCLARVEAASDGVVARLRELLAGR